MRSSVVASRSSSQLERIARLQPFSRSCESAGPTSSKIGSSCQWSTSAVSDPAGSSMPSRSAARRSVSVSTSCRRARGLRLDLRLEVVVGVQQALGVLGADVRRERVAHPAEPVGERAVAVERDPVAHVRSSTACSMDSARRRSRGSRGSSATTRATYFTRTRDLFEREVRGGMEAMLDALSVEFEGEIKIFRQHRDLRFSADKRPYKDRTYGVLGGYYAAISSRGLYAGTGYYRVARDQLERYPGGGRGRRDRARARGGARGRGARGVGARASRPRRAATRRTTRGSSSCATSGWSSGRCCPPATSPPTRRSRMSAARGARRGPSSRG